LGGDFQLSHPGPPRRYDVVISTLTSANLGLALGNLAGWSACAINHAVGQLLLVAAGSQGAIAPSLAFVIVGSW
jgi:hypothetical protein